LQEDESNGRKMYGMQQYQGREINQMNGSINEKRNYK
jgi:hypothetical protein